LPINLAEHLVKLISDWDQCVPKFLWRHKWIKVLIKVTIALSELSSVMAETFDRELIFFMHRGGMKAAAIARALQVPYSRVLRTLRPPVSNDARNDETIRDEVAQQDQQPDQGNTV
jgi:hypothetical protein